MAEDRDYQTVTPVTLEDGQDTESSEEVNARESKRKSERLAHEEMELIEVAEGGNDAAKSAQTVSKLGSLLKRVSWEWDEYDDIQRRVTAKALMNDEENPLLLAIKVTEKLHERAGKHEPNEDDFIALAKSVEEFTLRFLDPLKHEKSWRQQFAFNPETDIILDVAIKLKQKKFFDHPIIIGIMNERWHGNRSVTFVSGKLWWLFLNIWCLFDIVLFPLVFFIFFTLGCIATRVRCLRSIFQRRLFYIGDEEFKSTSLCKRYKLVFTLPYFIFVRDTLSYLALLGLHLAICVEPSQLKFSHLEWAILVFLFGRLFMEIKQVTPLTQAGGHERKTKLLRNYFRDSWNFFDLATLIIFFCAILPLRIFTWVESKAVIHNRLLEIANILYGFNTMLLTFRVIGSILEAFEGVGTIQIALFYIIRDAVVIVLHFGAITLAFSSTITKLFVAETSMAGEDTEKYSWWKILSHLGLSLLELSEGLDFFKSADKFSESLVYILYALYLVMGLILLINMLIALLSNTYQRVQDNSRSEWAFQKAVTIQTYSNYHPIPVPLNIISTLATCCCGLQKKEATNKVEIKRKHHIWLDVVVSNLKHKYRLKYGDSFPRSYKLDRVLDDTENTESMVNQLLYKTFTNQQGCDKALLPTGPKAWETSRHILVEGYLVTATNNGSATYRTAFSRRFPHFEAMILESGVTKWLAVGIVPEDYTYWLPGRAKESLGYHTGEKTIWSTDAEGTLSKKATKGPSACRRGVVVRCTVLFEEKQKRNGKDEVPVMFTVNGSRVVPEGDNIYIECRPDTPLYPQIGFYYENSVLAKMCPREDVDYQDMQIQELKSDLTEVKSEVVGVFKNLTSTKEEMVRHEDKSDLVDVRENLVLQEVKLELAGVKSELSELKTRLDSLLAKLGEKGGASSK